MCRDSSGSDPNERKMFMLSPCHLYQLCTWFRHYSTIFILGSASCCAFLHFIKCIKHLERLLRRTVFLISLTILQAGRSWVRFPMRLLNFSNLPNPSNCTIAHGSTQRLTEMSTRKYFWRVKRVRLTTSPPSVVFNLSFSRAPRCNFSSTLHP
jgi:hypothetical protein